MPKCARDPRNLTRRYTIDGLGNRTALSSPDSGQTTFTTNSLGAITTSTDARGIVTKYDYDLNNRLTAMTYGSTPYRLNYDEGQYGAGQLTSMHLLHLNFFQPEWRLKNILLLSGLMFSE